MIAGSNIVAVIPARGGSKGLKRKNVLPLGGKPLIAWSIEAAKASRFLDRVVLSSDDGEIMDTAAEWGCEVMPKRPAALSGDDITIEPVLIHALDTLDQAYDYIVLLQPTSPLRTAGDIDGCIRLCIESGAPSCVTVTAAEKPPHWMFSLSDDRKLVPFQDDLFASGPLKTRRQEHAPAFVLNGACYVARTDWLRESMQFIGPETVAYTMPVERSADVDTEFDMIKAEAVLAAGYR